MSQPPIERPWDPAPKPPRKQISGGKVGILAAVLLGLIVVGWISSALSGDSESKTPAASTGDKYGAFVVCQDQVSALLKSPSSAEFASISDSTVNGGGGTWRIISYVDSQNGFGAMLRTEWSCDVEHVTGQQYRATVRLS